jgi:hypothetical protein
MVLIEGGERGPVNVCREDGWHLPPTYRFCGQVVLIANNQTKLRKVSRIRLPILNFGSTFQGQDFGDLCPET